MGVSGKFKRIENQCNIRTMFKAKHTLRSSLMKTRPQRDQQQTAPKHSCECGGSYISETDSSLAVKILEHSHNIKDGLLYKSKLVQHA
jgi:hypothetical protein